MVKVLVIEDDINVADFVKRGLVQRDYEVEVASSGVQGLKMAETIRPDMVVLDLMLPDIDGIDICRELHSKGDMGIVILTARHLVGDRVLGLEAGADDYLPKPFAFEELVARIRSVLRRKKTRVEGIIHVADLIIDTKQRQVRRASRLIELTTREFELLQLLAENTGHPIRREIIIERIWGDNYEADTDPVKVYINSLRQKLNAAGETDLIQTLRGYGYVLRET